MHLQTPLPAEITQLTGITQSELEGGMDAAAALEAFLEFVGKDALVGYNLQFDLEFLRAACTRNQKPILTNRKIDLLPLARRKVIALPTLSCSHWYGILGWQTGWSTGPCPTAA